MRSDSKRTFGQVVKEACALLWKDIKDARWVIMIVIAYFAFLKIVVHNSCPMVLISGFPCPACGLTRAGEAVLHLDFAGAWRMHPFIYFIAIYVFLFCFRRYIQKKPGLGWLKWLAVLMIGGMVVFYIFRMMMYFPGEPPMGYYRYNLFCRLTGLQL